MKTKVISYFCDVDPGVNYYTEHGRLFIENMKNLDIPHHVEEIQSFGTYRANCLYKPQFILKCMNEFKCPILWLDIDSYVHKKLDMFDDINAEVVFATNSINEHGHFIPKASPIWLSQSENSYNFINKWIDKCNYYLKYDKKFFDHEIMLEVLEEVNIAKAILNYNFCVFPETIRDPSKEILRERGFDPVITMGISDGISKRNGLRDMGQPEEMIQANSSGQTYYTFRKIIK
jgi:hypothetical protein